MFIRFICQRRDVDNEMNRDEMRNTINKFKNELF